MLHQKQQQLPTFDEIANHAAILMHWTPDNPECFTLQIQDADSPKGYQSYVIDSMNPEHIAWLRRLVNGWHCCDAAKKYGTVVYRPETSDFIPVPMAKEPIMRSIRREMEAAEAPETSYRGKLAVMRADFMRVRERNRLVQERRNSNGVA
jgi:hypothetical protein